jgi:cysteine desulfurase
MHANNEVGTIGPVREAADLAHAAGALMHSDAVQSAGKMPVDVSELGVDLLTISAHKMYGPKGIGALYIRRGTEISPVLHGGGQERGRRPGTENVPLAVGFAEAFRLAILEREVEMRRVAALRDALEARVRSAIPAAIINGHPSQRLPTILNISIDNKKLALEGEMLVIQMDLHGVAATSGSACSSGSMQPSHVLLAMGRDVATAKATLRFSFGRSNADADIDYVADSLQEVITAMQKH